MRPFNKALTAALSLVIFLSCHSIASGFVSFRGRINSPDINIRADSTVNSEIIYKLDKGEGVEVTGELYDWYKIKLPQKAPAFIRKDLVMLLEEKNIASASNISVEKRKAKISKSRVNVRLKPSESSAILGKLDKDEVIDILGEIKDWYRIVPPADSFGWVHKKFVEKIACSSDYECYGCPPSLSQPRRGGDKLTAGDKLTVTGIVKPHGRIFKSQSTHALVNEEGKIMFMLKGNKKVLDTLNNRKVRITGKGIKEKGKADYLVIEIEKIEALE